MWLRKIVHNKGDFQKDCLAAGKMNQPRKYNTTLKNRRKEVMAAAVKLNSEYPALTKEQMKFATSKALISFNEKYLQCGKKNEGKEIVVSIAVVGEGMHPSTGYLSGKSIVNEMRAASITNSYHIMSNLVRLLTHKHVSYLENPTIEDAKSLGAPGELLFDAKCNMQLAMFIEKAMQVQVLYRKYFSQEKIRLLQLTAGNGILRQGLPYKVGICFFLVDKIKSFGFSFRSNLSNKQLSFPSLPKGILNAKDDDAKDNVSDDDDNAEPNTMTTTTTMTTTPKTITMMTTTMPKTATTTTTTPTTTTMPKMTTTTTTTTSTMRWRATTSTKRRRGQLT